MVFTVKPGQIAQTRNPSSQKEVDICELEPAQAANCSVSYGVPPYLKKQKKNL